jgi:hypothetical protein
VSTQTETLALEFARVLRSWLTAEQMRLVLERNAEGAKIGAAWCASHDFCDANMAMAEAMQTVLGREPDPVDNEADGDLWNAAWSRAKAAGFALV